MKILVVFYFLLSFSIGTCGDFEKYNNAYNIIKDSTIVYQHFYKCYDPRFTFNSFTICVSDRIYEISKEIFIPEIIEYEFGNPKAYGNYWKQLRDSLEVVEMNIWDKYGNDTNFKELKILQNIGFNNNCNLLSNLCDLKLFFSDFDSNNRLSAILLYNNGNVKLQDESLSSKCAIYYLFYFEGDNIVKVYIKKLFS